MSAPGSGARSSWAQQVQASDVDQLARQQDGWALHYEQLSAGRFSGQVGLVQLPGLRLVLEHSNQALRQRGQLGADVYGFALPLALPGEAFFAGQRIRPDTLMMGRGDDIDLCSPAGFAFIAVVVQGTLLAPLWQQLYGKPLAGWLARQVAVDAAPVPAAALREQHLALLQRLLARPEHLHDEASARQWRDALLLAWLDTIPAAVDTRGADNAAARRRLVDRACTLMQAQPDAPLTLTQLCAQVGASPRKLGYCFADVLGQSPARYLRAVRLNAARRALKAAAAAAAGDGVQDIAARLGFWHFGQFARDYRRQFGELPSATLRGDGAR